MDKQEAAKQISELLEQAHKCLQEAVKISDESGEAFHLPWGGEGTDEAGLGGWYFPLEDQWTEKGWNPSAHSC